MHACMYVYVCVSVCMCIYILYYIIYIYMYIYIYIWYTPPKISGTKFVIVMSYVLDISQTYHTISLRNPTHKKQVILIRFWNLWGCHVDLDMRECYTLYIYIWIYIYIFVSSGSIHVSAQPKVPRTVSHSVAESNNFINIQAAITSTSCI